MSQVELSRRTGLSVGSINTYLNKGVSPSLKNAVLMANALGVSLDRLSGRDSTNERPGSLTPYEELLIEFFRVMPNDERVIFLQVAGVFANKKPPEDTSVKS